LIITAALSQIDEANVTISDPTGHFLNSYMLVDEPLSNTLQAQFVIPIGDTYTVTVTDAAGNPVLSDIQATNCVGDEIGCQGTMGDTIQRVDIDINPPPSSLS